LSAADYSLYSKLHSVSEGHVLHRQTNDAPWGDGAWTDLAYVSGKWMALVSTLMNRRVP